jgi:hypothetical protein
MFIKLYLMHDSGEINVSANTIYFISSMFFIFETISDFIKCKVNKIIMFFGTFSSFFRYILLYSHYHEFIYVLFEYQIDIINEIK